MKQKLVIQEKFYNSIKKNINVLKSNGYDTPDEFFKAIIKKLNLEFNYFEIASYRFALSNECTYLSQYGAFIEGDDIPFEKVIIFFTPISSKQGNVIIEQSLMPTICKQMNADITFYLMKSIKK